MEQAPLHPIFRNAPEQNATLWRYMSFAKFVAMLETGLLRFTRIDQFDDHFEGVWPRRDLETWNKVGPLPAGFTEQMRRTRVAVSCWIHLPHESAGMWRLYAPGTEGVAIKTKFAKLQAVVSGMEKSLPQLLAGAAKVQYVDHASDSLIANLKDGDSYPNMLAPFMLKHVSYSYENEVRALVVAPHSHEIEPQGVFAPIDLADFVEGVVVTPLSQPWFEDVVIKVTKDRGLKFVNRSVLDRRIFWQQVIEKSGANT
jgi:hypothetical protein